MNIGLKIFLVVIVLSLPFAVLLYVSPIGDLFGICNADICPSDIKIKEELPPRIKTTQEKCFYEDDSTCTFTTGDSAWVSVVEGEDSWQVYASGLLCVKNAHVITEQKLSISESDLVDEVCFILGYFDKSEWTLGTAESDTSYGGSVTTYTFDRIA